MGEGGEEEAYGGVVGEDKYEVDDARRGALACFLRVITVSTGAFVLFGGGMAWN